MRDNKLNKKNFINDNLGNKKSFNNNEKYFDGVEDSFFMKIKEERL